MVATPATLTPTPPRRKPGPAGAFTPALGAAFLALLRQTGNARASARALGHRHLFDNRMRRDPAFARDCRAACAEADACLRAQPGPFARPIEVKSLDGGPRWPDRPAGIRKTSNGRTQTQQIREGDWTPETYDLFLSRLRASGNLRWSARAAGMDPSAVYRLKRKWPAVARDVDDAWDEAQVRLDYELIAHAHALLRRPGEPRGEDEPAPDPDIPFDPDAAMRILSFLERSRGGRTTRGRRKGPPDRIFDEAVASMLGKIEAIERHEKMMKKRRDEGEGA